jgi:hypothetical protein
MIHQQHAQGILTIENLLSVSECQEYIWLSEGIGYEPALVSTDLGEQEHLEFRNNHRVIIDSPQIAALLWDRVQTHLSPRIDEWIPASANERVRFYRYDVGQQFAWHSDGYYANSDCEQSKLTYLTYLNEDFRGGETCFRLRSASGEIELTRTVEKTNGT